MHWSLRQRTYMRAAYQYGKPNISFPQCTEQEHPLCEGDLQWGMGDILDGLLNLASVFTLDLCKVIFEW